MEKLMLDIAIILITTKIGGMLTKKINMPEVLGALFAGVIIGPSILGLVHQSDSISMLANLGVIMLMFLAGLETDLEEMKKAGVSSLLIAIGGVILPLIFGTLSAYAFFNDFYENLFIGVILTATSVSISVQTLKEMGKLNTRAGMNILGAAVIDDVIGLLVVSFVLSLATAAKAAGSGASVSATLMKVGLNVVLFCGGSFLAIAFAPKFLDKITKKLGKTEIIVIGAIALALVCGFFAEVLGIAAITGAYVCGLFISPVTNKEFIAEKVQDVSTYFLTPIFFASVGITANVKSMNMSVLLLTLLLLVTAILGKIIGCGGMARLYGISKRESIQIGMGMISRGEVALITTNLGLQSGIITEKLFVPTLIVVIVTTLVTPIFLKMSFSGDDVKKAIKA